MSSLVVLDTGARSASYARRHRGAQTAAVSCAALALSALCGAQETPPAAVDDQIVVLGRALEELRIRIELAEDDVYARFNEINGNDLFDVHCYERPPAGSRIQSRTCLSNAWRANDVAFADATVRNLQSAVTSSGPNGTAAGGAGTNHVPQQYRAKQLRTEGLVADEMQRLAREDPELNAAMMRLGQAYRALEEVSGTRPEWTLYREVTDDALPVAAQRLFEVRIGDAAWRHALGARTFTIAGVNGRIRSLRVECEEASARLEYETALDWTVPASWGACTLEVSAKRGTTFALYELE